MLEPVSAIELFLCRASLLGRSRLRLDPMKFRAACPRGAFDPARVRRPVARAMVTKSGVVHATVARRAAPSYFADLTRALCSHVVPAGGALDSPSASVSPPTL
jgi:hypothetical protein